MDPIKIQRVLVSVYDKANLDAFKLLLSLGCEFVSSGGTYKHLKSLGMPCTEVSSITDFPEILEGRVKTLHPMVHGGILADRGKQNHLNDLERHGIAPFDMVVVNFYSFSASPSIEMIDIGGPTMIRAAAKNYSNVVPLMKSRDYQPVVNEILQSGGYVSKRTRHRLAAQVFEATARFDQEIAEWFKENEKTLAST